MNKIILSLIAIPAICISFLHAQQEKNIRNITDEKSTLNPANEANSPISLKIEGGQIWVNGNLQRPEELPEPLRQLNPELKYQVYLQGYSEVKFCIYGKDYLVKNGKILCIPSTVIVPKSENPAVQQEYYSQLKNTDPIYFERLKREAALQEKSMKLASEYRSAGPQQRIQIRSELEMVLSELFDINIINQEHEIAQLEQEMGRLKAELKRRKANKSHIIQNRMKELTGE